MSTLRRRVELLEQDWRLRQDPLLLALVGPGETTEEAIERGCRDWGLALERFSMVWVLNMCGVGSTDAPLLGCEALRPTFSG